MNEKALVVLSGGQDSSTCLYWALKEFEGAEAICFDYGQRHRVEIEAAKEIAALAGVPLQIAAMPLLNDMTSNSLTRHSMDIEKNELSTTPNTFVDGRNLLFLTYAAIYAKSKQIKHIVTGVGQADYSGYPDCRDVFIKSLNVTLNLSMAYDFVIHTPMMWLDKTKIWAMADDLGVFDLIKEKTITCYQGVPAAGCGECPSCKLRNAGLKAYEAIRTNR